MAHRRTPSSRFTLPTTNIPVAQNVASMSSPLLPVSSLLHSFDKRHQKSFFTFKLRKAAFALCSLVALSIYLIFIARPSLDLAPIALRQNLSGMDKASSHAAKGLDVERPLLTPEHPPAPNHHKTTSSIDLSSIPQVELDAQQELAAIVSFLASLPANVIPPTIDPSQPIDPQLVLDFDTRSPRALQEVQQIVEDVWSQHPVMLFTKLRGAASREIRLILASMYLRPAPTVFEVDQREDADVLVPLFFRLTNTTELPILLVGGQSMGSLDEIRALHKSGELREIVANSGAVIDGARKIRGRK